MKLAKVAILFATIALLVASVQATPVVTWMGAGTETVGGVTYNKIICTGVTGMDSVNAVDLTFTAPGGVVLQNQGWAWNDDLEDYAFTVVDRATDAAAYNGLLGSPNSPYLATQDSYATLGGTTWSWVRGIETANSYQNVWARLGGTFGTSLNHPTTGIAQVLFTGNTLNLHMFNSNGQSQLDYLYDFAYVVPDPATLSLLVAGGVGLLLRRRRRA